MKQAAIPWNGLPCHVISPPRYLGISQFTVLVPFHHSNWIICLQFIFYLQTSISDLFYQPFCFVFLYYSNDPPPKPQFHQRTIPWHHSTKTTSIIVLSAGLFQGKTLSKVSTRTFFLKYPLHDSIPSYQSTYLTVPRAPFHHSVIPLRHSVTSSLRFCLHSDNQKIVFVPTIHSNNPFQQSIPTIHSNNPFQQSMSTNSVSTISSLSKHLSQSVSENSQQTMKDGNQPKPPTNHFPRHEPPQAIQPSFHQRTVPSFHQRT